MRMQMNYELNRRAFLLTEWDRAIGDYHYDCETSKIKEERVLSKQFGKMNRSLGHRFMLAYLMRCKIKHSFAFFQFRKLLTDQNLAEVLEVFTDRKQFMLKKLHQVADFL
jgi:hypothetical protein